MTGKRQLLEALRTEAHVWLVRTEEIANGSVLDACLALLSDEERDRHRRFHFDRDRHLYLVARALVRETLSRYLDIAPENWRFDLNEYGRPEIAASHDAEDLRFNLSHTRSLAGLVVTRGVDCGLDVEHTGKLDDPLSLIDRFFAPSEYEAIRALAVEERIPAFYRTWTLKESYIKARGMGLALPLSGFWFRFRDPAPPGIRFGAEIHDDPGLWQFHSEPLGSEHHLAVALRSGDAPLRVMIRQTIPRDPDAR